jgi:nucleoside-diphosphate-sugar epimerase
MVGSAFVPHLANIIHEAWRVGVQKLLFLGSSCIYPKLAPQPMSESALLTGQLVQHPAYRPSLS